MVQLSLNEVLNNYAGTPKIFLSKKTLSADFTPQNIPHREKQIKELALMLAPVLKGEKPSNVFIYGKTGTGKSLCTRHVADAITQIAKNNGANVRILYINCKMRKTADTEYRLLARLTSFFGEDVPYTGLPTNTLYNKFFGHLEKNGGSVVIILDEIDALVEKVGDEFLYNLTRISQELKDTSVSIIGISNKVSFVDNLDPRVRSSLSEEEIIFPPYNANELRDILEERTKTAFCSGSLDFAVVTKCAALAAQEHGDARKALDLLRVAAELAERGGDMNVTEKHVDTAEEKLDKDRIIEIVKSQPKHSKLVMTSILSLHMKGSRDMQTGDVFEFYKKLCERYGLKTLTQRRVSDLVSELDVFGIINASVVSKGRYGRTRTINIHMPEKIVSSLTRILEKEFPETFISFQQ